MRKRMRRESKQRKHIGKTRSTTMSQLRGRITRMRNRRRTSKMTRYTRKGHISSHLLKYFLPINHL